MTATGARRRWASPLVPAVMAQSETAHAILDWNVIAVDALDDQSHLAMVHGAVYDAVTSIDRRFEPLVVRVRAQRWYSQDAAAATAAYRVLLALLRGAELTPLYEASLVGIPAGEAKRGGIVVGEIAAAAMLAAHSGSRPFLIRDPALYSAAHSLTEFAAADPIDWTGLARTLAVRHGLGHSATARMFAMLYTTGADARLATGGPAVGAAMAEALSTVFDDVEFEPDHAGATLGRAVAREGLQRFFAC